VEKGKGFLTRDGGGGSGRGALIFLPAGLPKAGQKTCRGKTKKKKRTKYDQLEADAKNGAQNEFVHRPDPRIKEVTD